jgi:hypothetical protein
LERGRRTSSHAELSRGKGLGGCVQTMCDDGLGICYEGNIGCDCPEVTVSPPDFILKKRALVKFIPVTLDCSKFIPVASTPLKSTLGPVINAGFVSQVEVGFDIRYPLGITVVFE